MRELLGVVAVLAIITAYTYYISNFVNFRCSIIPIGLQSISFRDSFLIYFFMFRGRRLIGYLIAVAISVKINIYIFFGNMYNLFCCWNDQNIIIPVNDIDFDRYSMTYYILNFAVFYNYLL